MRWAVSEKLKALPLGWKAATRYTPLLELGGGRGSSVALALSRDGVERLVVIKSLRDGRDAAGRERLAAEAQLLARMSHPNVVQVLARSPEGREPAMVLEYLAGPSLAALMALANDAPELTLPLRIAIVMRVLSALDYIHRLRDLSGNLAGVVHGAVSPGHVMVTYQGQVKLIDFAGARTRPSKPPLPPERRLLSYWAPEHFRGWPDVRVDVFAAGAILWELVARAPLWGQLPTLTVMRRVRVGSMPRLREVLPGVDAELDRICKSALAPRAEDRYPSARAMIDDLERYLATRGGVPSDATLGAFVERACREQRREGERLIDGRLAELAAPLGSGARTARAVDGPRTGGTPRRLPLAAAALIALGGLAWGAFDWGTALGGVRRHGVEPAPVIERPWPGSSDAAPSAERSARLLELDLDVRPSHSVLFLDGQRLPSNPLHALWVDDGRPHAIRAEAAGFLPLSKTLEPGSGLSIDTALVPSPVETHAAHSSRGAALPRAPRRGAAVGAREVLALADGRLADGRRTRIRAALEGQLGERR